MAPPRVLVFDHLPSLAAAYPRLLWRSFRRRSQPSVPDLETRVRAVRVRATHLERYRTVCDAPSSDVLPWTYPQVLAAGLQAQLFLAPDFGRGALGIVHVANEILATREIRSTDCLDFACRFGARRETERGFELEILTEVSVGGTPAYRSTSTVLWRRRRERRPKEAGLAAAAVLELGPRWHLPADLGRRYAAVSGDRNPIHLYPFTARWFGFDRPILHGLCSLARVLAGLAAELPPAPLRIVTTFERPLSLPAEVRLARSRAGSCLEYRLATPDGAKAYLYGIVTALDQTASTAR